MSVTGAGTPGAPGSRLAHTGLDRLTATYGTAAGPERAVAVRAYRKDVAPFLGPAARPAAPCPAPCRRACP